MSYLSAVLHLLADHIGGSLLNQVSYTRDSLSRIASQTDAIQGETKSLSYTYDPIGRLSTVKRNDTLVSHYFYDPNGNRDSAWTLAGGIVRGTYDAQDRLLTYGNASYFYTKNGELTENRWRRYDEVHIRPLWQSHEGCFREWGCYSLHS